MSVYRKSFAILISVFLILSCASCSTSPSADFVINKNEGVLEEKIANSSGTGLEINSTNNSGSSATFHETSTFTSSNGVVSFNIDANIKIADAEKWPVLRVTPKLWTSDDIEHITKVFTGDNVVYEYTQAMTKDEIMHTILEIQQKLSDPDALLAYYGNEDTVKRVIAQLEKELAAAERDYINAPDYIERVVTDFEFHDDTYWYTDYSILHGIEGTDTVKATTTIDGIPFFIWAIRQTNGTYRYIDYSIWAYSKFPEGAIDGCIYYQTTPFTQEEIEQAKTIIINTLKEINITDWKYLSHTERTLEENGVTYYFLTFDIVPVYNGIDGMLSSFGDGMYIDNEGNYISDYYDESILIKYSNGRIMSYNHLSPLTIEEVLNENVELITYEAALNRICTQLEYALTSGNLLIEPYNNIDYSVTAATVTITSIEFCLVRTPIKDNHEDFYMLPGWIVRGSYTIDELKHNSTTVSPDITTPVNIPLLCINGVDGSVVFSI